MKPFVTIIVPVHNEALLISQCLDAILKLDYPRDSYEVIVVDDGSTDKTPDIVEKYVKSNSNIFLVKRENAGKGSAVNSGLARAKGKYVVVIDSDTMPESNYVTEVVKCFEEGDNIKIVTGRSYFAHRDTVTQKMIAARVVALNDYSIYGFCPTGTGTSFRLTDLKAAGGFEETTTATTPATVVKVLGTGGSICVARGTRLSLLDRLSFKGYLTQRLRWRESGRPGEIGSIIANVYTHGLSIVLFLGALGLVYAVGTGQFSPLWLTPVVLVLAAEALRYSKALWSMLIHRYHNLPYLLLSIGFEQMLRIISVPYLAYRLVKPREKPVFKAER